MVCDRPLHEIPYISEEVAPFVWLKGTNIHQCLIQEKFDFWATPRSLEITLSLCTCHTTSSMFHGWKPSNTTWYPMTTPSAQIQLGSNVDWWLSVIHNWQQEHTYISRTREGNLSTNIGYANISTNLNPLESLARFNIALLSVFMMSYHKPMTFSCLCCHIKLYCAMTCSLPRK